MVSCLNIQVRLNFFCFTKNDHFNIYISFLKQTTTPVSKRKGSQAEPEAPTFGGLKLKKSNRRPSQLPEEPKLPTVELKHHEFEKLPQTEEVHFFLFFFN